MPAGVYLHIPFCKSRCSYCDFATDIYRNEDDVDRYIATLVSEIENFRPSRGRILNADTIYFGGGTPSLLSSDQIGKILGAVKTKFDIDLGPEITMEMNPATVTPETLRSYKSLGVNRASFGVQTFNDRALKLLARGHDANDARQTYRMLRDAGFENVSFDLIAGLPGQTVADWKRNLTEAIALSPEHLSLYLLEIHEGTPLAEQVRSGRRPMPDEDLAAEMYELMCEKLTTAGYEHYEISNFAKPGFESRHNTKYWTLESVYGFGVSAHSFDGFQRYSNERDTAKYVEQIATSSSAEVSREWIDHESEFIFLGLRLDRGIDIKEFKERFGTDLVEKHHAVISELRDQGLVDLTVRSVRLTRKGRLFSNEVFQRFV